MHPSATVTRVWEDQICVAHQPEVPASLETPRPVFSTEAFPILPGRRQLPRRLILFGVSHTPLSALAWPRTAVTLSSFFLPYDALSQEE